MIEAQPTTHAYDQVRIGVLDDRMEADKAAIKHNVYMILVGAGITGSSALVERYVRGESVVSRTIRNIARVGEVVGRVLEIGGSVFSGVNIVSLIENRREYAILRKGSDNLRG